MTIENYVVIIGHITYISHNSDTGLSSEKSRPWAPEEVLPRGVYIWQPNKRVTAVILAQSGHNEHRLN